MRPSSVCLSVRQEICWYNSEIMASVTIFRLANISDYEAVMDIDRNVYGGFDYLPGYYNWFIHSTNNIAVVGVSNGKVVAFCNYFVVEGGTAVVAMSGRLVPSIRGMDATKRMKMFAQEMCQQKWPTINRVLDMSSGSSSMDKRLIRHKESLSLLTRWNIQRSVFTRDQLNSIIHSPGQESAARMLSPNDVNKSLVKQMEEIIAKENSHFLVDAMWIPLQVTAENIKYASKKCDVIASFSEINGQRLLNSCSFVSVSPVAMGLKGCIQYNGKSNTDCFQHMALFFKLFAKRLSSCNDNAPKLCSHIVVPLSIEFQAIRNHVESYFGKSFIYPGYEARDDINLIATSI